MDPHHVRQEKPACHEAPHVTVRLELLALEDRIVPSDSGQLLWTGPAGGVWSNAANWTDPVSGGHFVPTSTDQVLFGDGGLGANTASTMDLTSLTVDRVIMDSSYTATLSISGGNTLTTTNYFQQYGTLSMTGGATISAGTFVSIYGAVSATPALCHLDASGSFFLYSSGSITTLGAAALEITSANFSDAGTITLGTPGVGGGALTVTGAFTQSAGSITLNTGSLLAFADGGSPSAYPIFQSTVTMLTATQINTDTVFDVSGGTFNAIGVGAHLIAGSGGNLAVLNSGSINVGTSGVATAAFLTMGTGSLTVGALTPNLTATGGTLNLYTGAAVVMPAVGTITSTFVVTALGVLNMNGASIIMAPARVTALTISQGQAGLANGQLNSLAPAGFTDVINGNLVNNGSVGFGGAVLHMLTISAGTGGGSYTQGSSGTLAMRLANGGASDTLTVAATATLNGTLNLSASGGTLTPGDAWAIIGAGAFAGDFTTKIFPADGNPNWVAGPPVPPAYPVAN